jgi:pyruvate dehydrogenase (quinone)
VEGFASELLVDRLVDWGIDTVFGLPGDGVDGVAAAFRRRADRIRLVLVHHEEAAAFMATGYAKATGKLGVCLATSGPGAIHLLNGLYDAKLDHQPVLAVTELLDSQLLGTSFPQELRLEQVFEDVADYNVLVDVPVQIPAVVDIAVGHALARGTVSHITFPHDLRPDGDAPYWGAMTPSTVPATAPVFVPAPGVPPAAELAAAAAVLNQGSRRAILVGVGGFEARAELLAVADRLASPIVKSLPGKAAVPDDHPLTTGCAGALGTVASQQVLTEADTLLVLGTNYPWADHPLDPDRVRTVRIEAELTRLAASSHTEVPLVGDAAETLQALLPLLDPAGDSSFVGRAQAAMARWRELLAAEELGGGAPVRPQYLARAVDRLAAGDAVLCADSGAMATWSARHFDVRHARDYLLSANLATMAAGLPYAIAAQLARPGRQCIAYVGSEGFAKLMAEFLTAVQHRVPVNVVVSNAPRAPAAGAAADFALWARGCGGLGIRVERSDEVEPALRAVLDHPGPALLDVLVDPAVTPRPLGVRGAQGAKR